MAADMTDREPLAGLRLLGGRPCLDFCNTVEEREKPGAREFLTSYGDLIAWAERAGLVAGTGARSLLAEAGRHPVAARAPFDEALVLREALFRVFSSVVTGEPAAVPDVELLEDTLRRASAHARLTRSGDGFAWSWSETDGDLDLPLWLVARSAAELLTSNELERVGKCSGRDCGWFFLDTSKNRTRRWCSMDGCGSRAKMRRHYARRRSVAAADRPREQVDELG